MSKSLISLSVIGLLGGAALFACSAPDPGLGDFGPRPHGTAVGAAASTGGNQTPAPGGGTTPGADGGGTTPGGGDGGLTTPPPGDGGATEGGGGGGLQPFAGLPAYASNPIATANSARTRHQAAGQAAQQPNTDCLGCHVTGGNGTPFLAAGFVATAANGTTGAPDVEVAVFNATLKQAFSAHTDPDGFFWINPPNGGATGTFCAGARQQNQQVMPQTETNYDCQTAACHGGNPIHYP